MALVADIADERSDRSTLVNWLPWLRKERPRRSLIVGTVAAWDLSEQWRYRDRGVLLRIAERTWPGMWPGELARPYARASWTVGGGRKAGPARPSDEHLDIPLPSWCALEAGDWRRGQWACVDLSQAYWSIARPYGMDVRCRPSTGTIACGSVPWADQTTVGLRDLKRLQALIVATARTRRMQLSINGRHEARYGPGWWFQPQLWAAVALTLQAVAHDAVDLGAVAVVCPDAYVVPDHQAVELQTMLAERWGLQSKVQWRAGMIHPRHYQPPPYPIHRHGRLHRLSKQARNRLQKTREGALQCA